MDFRAFLIITKIVLFIAACGILVAQYALRRKMAKALETPIPELEFTATDREDAELARWQGKTTAELMAGAAEGNRAALYLVGMACLDTEGSFSPETLEAAGEDYLDQSAALGFAPAIYEMMMRDGGELKSGVERFPLPLFLTYLGLLIALGHNEFRIAYDRLADKFRSDAHFKPEVMAKIERLVVQKKAVIQENQQALQDSVNKEEFCESLAGITDSDETFFE